MIAVSGDGSGDSVVAVVKKDAHSDTAAMVAIGELPPPPRRAPLRPRPDPNTSPTHPRLDPDPDPTPPNLTRSRP